MTLIGTAVAVGLSGLAIVNWHVALQYIGCNAALFSLAKRVTSYSSFQVRSAACAHNPDVVQLSLHPWKATMQLTILLRQ